MMMTGMSGSMALSPESTWIPSISRILMSEIARSKRFALASRSASTPERTATTSYPSFWSMMERYWHMLSSSSTIRIRSAAMASAPFDTHASRNETCAPPPLIPGLGAVPRAPLGAGWRLDQLAPLGSRTLHRVCDLTNGLRQPDAELGATFGDVVGFDPATMVLDDACRDRQPEARALRLGGVERFEDGGLLPHFDAGAAVPETHPYARRVLEPHVVAVAGLDLDV